MKRRLKALVLAVGFTSLSSSATGGGVPTIDGVSVAQLVAILTQLQEDYGIQTSQLQEALKTVQTLEQQVQQLERQWSAITGNFHISDVLNGTAEKDARRIAETLSEINNTLSGNGLSSDNPLAQSVSAQQATFGIVPSTNYYDVESQPGLAASHEYASKSAVTGIAMAQFTFQRSEALIAETESLIAEIDQQQELKAAVDLNTRMQGQVAIMLAEMMRMQAANGQLTGAMANKTLRDAESGRRALSFRTYGKDN